MKSVFDKLELRVLKLNFGSPRPGCVTKVVDITQNIGNIPHFNVIEVGYRRRMEILRKSRSR